MIDGSLTIEYGTSIVTLYEDRLDTVREINELDRYRLRPMFIFVMGLYGEKDIDPSDVSTEDMRKIVGGEVQIDWYTETYSNIEGTEKIMENVTANQTRRVKTVAGAVRTTEKQGDGPSETKEAPAKAPSKRPAGKVAPIRNPKPDAAEIKRATTRRESSKEVKPARGAKTKTVAPAKRGRKAAPAAQEKPARKAAPAARKSPARESKRRVKHEPPKGKGKLAARGIGEYIMGQLLLKRPPTVDQLIENVHSKFPDSTANTKTLIYAYRSKLYTSGQLAKPEGSRGRKSAVEMEQAQKRARGRTRR
jgi:hypothetical protein